MYVCMSVCVFCNNDGKFSSKTTELRTNVQGQSCHHVILTSASWSPKSLFPLLRASIWDSCRQNVHKTAARARFAFQNV